MITIFFVNFINLFCFVTLITLGRVFDVVFGVTGVCVTKKATLVNESDLSYIAFSFSNRTFFDFLFIIAI